MISRCGELSRLPLNPMNHIVFKIKLVAAVCLAVANTLLAQTALKDAFQNDFLIGVAVNESQFFETDKSEAALVKTHFNSITPENDLKWEQIHPEPGRYNFAEADRYVAFGETNRMFIIGHTLIWHSQTPPWVFQGADGRLPTRAEMLARMQEHISTIVGRYRGRIKGWDVVNEAVDEDGSLRATPWLKAIGEDYLVKAYQFVRAADPQAELYYNDYGLENSQKRAGAVRLIKNLQAAGIKVSAVGLQGHYKLRNDVPSTQEVDAAITDFMRLGVKVMITELDVDVLPSEHETLNADVSARSRSEDRLNPFPKRLPAGMQQKLAARYADLFAVFLRHRNDVTRVTFWGVTDADSWLNDWPIAGRTSYPLLFDRAGRSKLAFERLIELGKSPRMAKISAVKPVENAENF